MATKSDLRGSFGSLIDSFSQRFDPMQAQNVVEQWLGLMGTAASIARERSKWRALPDTREDYAPAIKSLDEAARSLVLATAETDAMILAALSECGMALDRLQQLLDR